MPDRLYLAVAVTFALGMATASAQTAAGTASGGQATPSTASPVTGQPARPGCHPSYLPARDGTCVPIATNVQCLRDGGTGPAVVHGPFRVVGPDVYYLDPDADGTACNRDKN